MMSFTGLSQNRSKPFTNGARICKQGQTRPGTAKKIQILKNMTHSYIAVGLSGAIELAPLIIFGLYGGLLADALDRKKMMWQPKRR
jgi:hypothetical protein